MPDVLNATGLTVKSLPEVVNDLVTGLQLIFGTDINVNSNSPDGQTINIYAQQAEDLRELLVSVYNSFDPDQAVGVILDKRVAINNIERNGGSYTIQPMDIVVDRTVALAGLDANEADPNGVGYTVQDDAGNKFILVDSTTLTAGTHSGLNFRAQMIGQVQTTIGTITNQTTIVLGVVSVNNSVGALDTGTNEESDANLRIRRQQSVANGSAGYLNGIQGVLLALDGVTDAKVYENFTDSVDANGIPAHGTWSIVEGGANTDIANAIYRRKSYGSNMKGAVAVDIVTAAGAIFVALFDRPTAESLYIEFNIQKTIATATFDNALIAQYIVDNIQYLIGQYAETASLTALAQAAINSYGGGGVPTELRISSDNITYVDYLVPSTLDKEFVLDVTRINITDL